MKSFICVFSALLFIFVMIGEIGAATLTVTNTDDDGAGSLRQAVAQANNTFEADTIVFDAGVFSTPKTITLTSGQLIVTYSLTINGPGANLLSVSGNHQSRIFFSNFSGTSISINALTLKDGFASSGGAIYASATLSLNNVIITGNTAMGADVGSSGSYAGMGGGIYSTDFLTLTNSVVSNNLASGVIFPNPTNGDFGTAGMGGGIYSNGSLTAVNSKFINNVAKGISSPNVAANQGGGAFGGAIYGDIYAINSSFTDNKAVAGNGGAIPTNGITGNGGEAYGGAIFSSNSRLLNTTISNNAAIAGNGGTATGNGGSAMGGGIRDANLRAANTTIVNNMVTAGDGAVGGNGFGGGIYTGSGQWSVINATVAGNSVAGGTGTFANGAREGGGVYSTGGSAPASNFRNNIVAENSAATGPDVFGAFINTAHNLIGIGDGSSGITHGVNGNLVGTAGSPLDPQLAQLANNGGLTQTRALLDGSLAINAGNNALALNPFTSQALQFDQRNLERVAPIGGQIDIGAFEAGASTVPVVAAPDLQNASDTGISNTDNLTRANAPVFDVANAVPGALVELLRNDVVVASVTASSATGNVSITDGSPPLNGTVNYTCRQRILNAASNVSAPLTVTFDNTAPTVTINQAATQSDPTRLSPVNFTVVFNEPVAFFSSSNVSLAASTANVSTAFMTVNFINNTTFSVEIRNVTSNGAVITAQVPGSTVRDLAGNLNQASISTDNAVILDNVSPTVMINQDAGQSDPTSAQPIIYSVVFSESVSGLTAADISLAGSTANVSAANVTVSGSGGVYQVRIANIGSTGLVRASVIAGAAADALGNVSLASISLDNSVTLNSNAASYDFDGDRKTDIGVFRPNGLSGAEWWCIRSSNAETAALQFGGASDRPVPADYTGDGKTDIAFYRASSSEWFVLRSEDFTFYAFPFGAAGDLPLTGDFDGDGRADAGVFRPSTATWYIQQSSGGTIIQAFGASGDKPVIADYDGDGKSDLAIYRDNAGAGEWWIQRSSDAQVAALQFGAATDKPVQGDYTGDGRADVAVWRAATGEWFVLRSENGSFYAFPFGATGDVPAPGDYDGDGRFDAAVFRASQTTWFIQRSTGGTAIQQFGAAGDQPIPSVFAP